MGFQNLQNPVNFQYFKSTKVREDQRNSDFRNRENRCINPCLYCNYWFDINEVFLDAFQQQSHVTSTESYIELIEIFYQHLY